MPRHGRRHWSPRPGADQTVRPVDRYMVLVAEGWDGQIDRRQRTVLARLGLGVLDHPAGIAILLRQLGRLVLPAVGNAPVLDGLLLGQRVALLGRRHNRGIDDLAGHGKKARGPQGGIETLEQAVDRRRLLQRLAKCPDRIGVRHHIGQAEPEKAHERQAVLDQILGALVGERVHRLQDQDFEHQHMIERRPTALRAITARRRRFQVWPKHLKVDHGLDPLQIVALGGEILQSLIDAEKTGHPARHDRPLSFIAH